MLLSTTSGCFAPVEPVDAAELDAAELELDAAEVEAGVERLALEVAATGELADGALVVLPAVAPVDLGWLSATTATKATATPIRMTKIPARRSRRLRRAS